MDPSQSSTEPSKVATPDQRIGSYRILKPLGTGGMSSVYLAEHVESHLEVALKVLTRSLARNANLLQRFFREARSAEALEHPNIVTIYDRGIDRGRHYLVLEYVAGGDLHDRIQREGPLSVVEAVSVVKSVADGLKYAAGRGVIHRDIKPSNILRTPTGQIKIIDLGLALQGEFEDERVTRDGTTVGTVDYMAPEQARDSRATSVLSDLYSLGCTFYYFLTGIPPFPGGDITDKLTRHAKSPVPDVRDLRPDLPIAITAIIQSMMAKRPEDRFASYDDLITALEAVPSRRDASSQPVALVPLDETTDDDPLAVADDRWPSRASGELKNNGSADVAPNGMSLAEMVADELTDGLPGRRPSRPAALEPPMPRQSLIADEDIESSATELDAVRPVSPAAGAGSLSVWMIAGALVGVAFIILAIGVVQFMGAGGPIEDTVGSSYLAGEIAPAPLVASAHQPAVNNVTSEIHRPARTGKPSPVSTRPARKEPESSWIEPTDPEPPANDPPGARIDSDGDSNYIPEWARSPIPDRIDGHFVAVRRVTAANDHGSTIPMLDIDMALDQKIGGTIELADEGPLLINNPRVAGESRLIRARKGYRAIVQIAPSSSESARRQRAVFMLERKNLTLESVDLIVNVRDLSPNQTVLFSCTGGNLTLKNCSITILNNRSDSAFTVFHTQSAGSQPTRIRLEESQVCGGFTTGFDLASGSTELVLRKSVVLGGSGPSIGITDTGDESDRRLFFVHSLLAGPGPIIDLIKAVPGHLSRTVTVRSYGSVLGRLKGAGFAIASVISSIDSAEPARKQIDWVGDRNLYAGWKGFFARGTDHTVIVPDLAAVRSTWNASEAGSQEFLPPWPYRSDEAMATKPALEFFLPDREAILRQVAQPRSGFVEKTVAAYPEPAIPEPVGWAVEGAVQPRFNPGDSDRSRAVAAQGVNGGVSQSRPVPGGVGDGAEDLELTFNTEMPPWRGDLGAFLKDQLSARTKRARVRVVGSGPHYFSPVRLPSGLRLEIRVDPLSVAEPPSWSPLPQSTGLAMIELQRGDLVLSNVVLHHEQSSRLDHLIHVEDGCLIVSHCQLTSASSSMAGDLIAFSSTTTKPRPSDTIRPLFTHAVDRPVCSLVDSVLITGGTALKAELGRGLITVSQCAVAAGESAIELVPSKVARHRFDADLWLDHCTLTAERSIIRLGPWPGRAPGPDRPWLITSRNCAFLAMYDRPTRETVLLRADSDALACGTVFWQAVEDALDVDCYIVAGEGPPPANRARDLQHQWVQFWGASHIRNVDGSRASTVPSVRFLDKLRVGRISPADLILDPQYHPGRIELKQGADLRRQGLALPAPRSGRTRN